MSKSLKILLLTLGVATVGATVYFLTKTKPGKELLYYIPNDAGSVVQINLPALAKLVAENKDSFSKLQFLKQMNEDDPEPIVSIISGVIKDPKNSGLDFKYPAMYFSQFLPRGTVHCILLKLSDNHSFQELIKKHTPAGNETGDQNGVQYAELESGMYIAWNEKVALISDQRTENKTYFENILNRKNPGANGNILLSGVLDSDGMFSGVFRLDEFFENPNALPKRGMTMDGLKNPFPKGTAVHFDFNIEHAKIQYNIWLSSLDKKALKNLNFLKQTGNFRDYDDALFSLPNPYLLLSLSIDPEKLMNFMSLINPELNEKEIPELKQIKEFWNGDLVLAVSLKSMTKNSDGELEQLYADQSFIDLIVHMGTSKSAKPLLDEYLGQNFNSESNTYKIPFAQLNIGLLKNEIVISNNDAILKTLVSGSFKSPDNVKKVKHNHSNSPFFGAVFPASSVNIPGLFMFNSQSYMQKEFMESIEASYSWIDNSKMSSEILFKKHKKHIILRMLQGIDEQITAEKNARLEWERRIQIQRAQDSANGNIYEYPLLPSTY